MVRWEGRSASQQLKVGTPILLMAKAQIRGQPRDVLNGPQDIWIELDTKWVEARLTEADPSRAILQMPEGERWVLTPRQGDEWGSNITTPGMYSEDWIVREQLPVVKT